MSAQYSLFFIQRFKGRVLFNVPMSDHTSFGIGGVADVMAFPRDEADLKDIISFAEAKKFAYYVIGGGTNILVRDGGIRGIVINTSEGFDGIEWAEGAKAVVGAGVRTTSLASGCAERGLSGFEFACGIPGTVGGAAAVNAGAYGTEMKDLVDGVEVVGRKGRKNFIPGVELDYGYRSSSLPRGDVIVRVHMSFTPDDPEEIKKRMDEYRSRRRSTGSIGHKNAGSVFKNPGGAVAGKLIEEAGLKGEVSGDAEVSSVHANYIVNRGRARAKDVLTLMAHIRDRVYSKTGIVLEPEIRVIGED